MHKSTLYHLFSMTFCVIVLLANVISAKMVPLPFFKEFSIPAGLFVYPLTFLLSDLVTEFYGVKAAKRMVYLTLAMNAVGFALLQFALALPASSEVEQGAFDAVFNLSSIRIFSSLAAYCISQLADIYLYAFLKRRTPFLWARSGGSTIASQLIDTLVIDLLFLYWGMGMDFSMVLPIMLFSITYKACFSLALTPFFYIGVYSMKELR